MDAGLILTNIVAISAMASVFYLFQWMKIEIDSNREALDTITREFLTYIRLHSTRTFEEAEEEKPKRTAKLPVKKTLGRSKKGSNFGTDP